MEGTTSNGAVDKGSVLSRIYDGAVFVVTRTLPTAIVGMMFVCLILLAVWGMGSLFGSKFNPFTAPPVWLLVVWLAIGAVIGIVCS